MGNENKKSKKNIEAKKLDIVIIAQYFPPDMGGASARASNVAYGLSKMGHNVKVISAFPHYPLGIKDKSLLTKSHFQEYDNGLTVFRVWIPPLNLKSIKNNIILNTVFCFSALIPLFNGLKYDVVWAANPNVFAFFPAMMYALVNNKKMVRNVDDLWPEVFLDGRINNKLIIKILEFITRLTYSIPVMLTPISQAYKRQIVEKYKQNSDKIRVIPVGVNKIPKIKSRDVSEFFTVMYSGILNSAYDFEMIIKTAKKLENYSNIRFFIRGIGRTEDHVRALLKEYSAKNVVFSTEFLEKSVLVSTLAQADAFILPMKGSKYTEHGLPTKLFEYQSYGKPIICASRGESARYVENTKSGIVIPVGDVDALYDTVIRLFEDENLRKQLGENGKNYVETYLVSDRLGERMSELMLNNYE